MHLLALQSQDFDLSQPLPSQTPKTSRRLWSGIILQEYRAVRRLVPIVVSPHSLVSGYLFH